MNQPSTKTLTLGAVGAILGIFILWYIFGGIGYRNRAAELKQQFVAVEQGNKVDYDAMWKIISQTAQVPSQYSSDFQKAYSAIIASGSGTDKNAVSNLFAVATGMKVPQLDSSLYRKVQDVIESERTKFANAQKQAADIAREYNTLVDTFPGSFFIGDHTHLEVKLVTSDRTEKAFETGKDNETNLFGGNKP